MALYWYLPTLPENASSMRVIWSRKLALAGSNLKSLYTETVFPKVPLLSSLVRIANSCDFYHSLSAKIQFHTRPEGAKNIWFRGFVNIVCPKVQIGRKLCPKVIKLWYKSLSLEAIKSTLRIINMKSLAPIGNSADRGVRKGTPTHNPPSMTYASSSRLVWTDTTLYDKGLTTVHLTVYQMSRLLNQRNWPKFIAWESVLNKTLRDRVIENGLILARYDHFRLVDNMLVRCRRKGYQAAWFLECGAVWPSPLAWSGSRLVHGRYGAAGVWLS